MRDLKWNLLNVFFLVASVVIIILSILGGKNNVFEPILLASIVIVLVVIDIQAPNIAKLSSDNPKVKTLRIANRIAASTILIFAVIVRFKQFERIISTGTKELLTVGAVSLFMMVFGNLAPKIPFNRYVGLRLPWTIRDEDTWRLAHKLVGYTSFPLALIQFGLAFFIPAQSIVPICILLWVAIPGIYSGWFFFNKFRKI